MGEAARTAQLAVAYRRSKRGDSLLLQAAGLAESLKASLAVVVPFVLPDDGPACCGIRGRRWVDILRELATEDAVHARRLLANAGAAHSVTVSDGDSVPLIIDGFVAEGDRQLFLPRRAPGTLFTRSSLRQARRLVSDNRRRSVSPGPRNWTSHPPSRGGSL